MRAIAALVIRAGFLVVLVPLDVRGFHLVRARSGPLAAVAVMPPSGPGVGISFVCRQTGIRQTRSLLRSTRTVVPHVSYSPG